MWAAGYADSRATSDGETSVQVVIEDIASEECPRSILIRNPQVQDLIQIHNQAEWTEGIFGPPHEWPGAFADAMALLHKQSKIDENARYRAK